jgi:hypothetical protein
VISCIVRHKPRIEPKFHQMEMLIGAGRSIIILFIGFMRGWCFRVGLNIRVGLEGPEGAGRAEANFCYYD